MFVFEAPQVTYDIGGVVFGGQPGEYPTVLAASVFYMGDKLVIDEPAGEFHREKAYQVLEKLRNTCQIAGVPLVVDMIGGSPRAMENYVEWISSTGLPFFIDGTTVDVRLAGARKTVELGLEDLCIYDSIGPETKQLEIDALRELGLKTTIVIAHNARKPTFLGKVEIAEQVLETARQAGFTQLILDTAVLDIVEPGPCSKAIWLLKNKYGFPVGCSPTHCIQGRWSVGREKFGKLGYTAAKVSLATSTIMLGADYFMYGIKQLEIVPAMAMVDASVAYTAQQQNIRPKTKTHPLYLLMKSSTLATADTACLTSVPKPIDSESAK